MLLPPEHSPVTLQSPSPWFLKLWYGYQYRQAKHSLLVLGLNKTYNHKNNKNFQN